MNKQLEPDNTVVYLNREFTLHSLQGYRRKQDAEDVAISMRSSRCLTITQKQPPSRTGLWYVYTSLVDVMAEV